MSGTAMDTCMRGFSFMPENKIENSIELQYIEGAELERTWKSSRRQRLRQQEQKIWEQFVKEQDVLNSVCEDDPYQFLDQLPDSYLKELMELQLHKMKKETEQEEQVEEQTQGGNSDSPREPDDGSDHNDNNNDNCDMFHVFDDEKEEEQSGPEEEPIPELLDSPCTVRERHEEKAQSPLTPPLSPDKGSSKSSENVSGMIESSIYYAKVRDLRMKINEELLTITTWLEQQDIHAIDPDQLIKMCRRSTEFCARFNRIYMYQLHRQLHQLGRHSAAFLPLARHTQFRAQAARAASLHHNLLQALQVFHKSLEQTACIRESSDLARSLAQVCAEVSQVCRAVPTPKHLSCESDLYNDDMMVTCEKLEEVLGEYSAKMNDYMTSVSNNNSARCKRSSKSSMKKRYIGNWSKTINKTKSSADSRLSMYSLDRLRVSVPARSSSSKDNQSGGTSKVRVSVGNRKQEADVGNVPPKSTKKSPRSRRPLMRAPSVSRRRPLVDHDIATMVEAVRPWSARRGAAASPRPAHPAHPAHPGHTGHTGHLAHLSPRDHSDLDQGPLVIAETSRECIEEVAKILSARDQRSPATPPAPLCSPLPNPLPAPLYAPLKASPRPTAQLQADVKDETKTLDLEPGRCEVTRIVRQLCGGDTARSRNERVSGAKNAQLFCVSGNSPRQPSTPQLLRILEETIQKKIPKALYNKELSAKAVDRFRLALNISEQTGERLFQYRTKFVQHMLTSPMYANCTVGKPWELISSVSEQLIDELLLQCAKEMELNDVIKELYKTETC